MTPTAPPRRPTVVRFVAYSALLFASWNHNVFGIPSGVVWYDVQPRAGYFGFDSYLTLNRLGHAATGGPALAPLVVDSERPVYYLSQFGAQGIVLGWLQQGLGAEPGRFALAAAGVFGLLTAGLFAAVLAVAGRRFGPLVGDIAAVLAAPAPSMLQFGPSLYWATFLLAGPFALMWLFGGCVNRPGRAWPVLVAGFGLAVFAKCLCGYEYVTTVVGGGVAALWYHQHVAGVEFRRRLRAAGVLISVGLTGFALAVGCHALQLWAVVGADPVQTIRGRAVARTVVDGRTEYRRAFPSDWFPFLPDRYGYPANCFVDYLRQPVVAAPAGWGRAQIRVPMKYLAATVLILAATAAVYPLPRPVSGMIGAAVLALGAAASWQVLAVNHMCTQTPINLIVYYLGFVPLALILIGCLLNGVCRWPAARVAATTGLAVGVVVSAGFSLKMASCRAAERERADAAAVAAVQDLIRRHGVPEPGSVVCRVERMGGEEALHPNLRVEFGWQPLGEWSAREPVLIVAGWAVDLDRSGRYRAPRVVVAVDGEVVPTWVARRGRPDLDGFAGRAAPGSAFLLVIPSRLVPDRAKVRVYAVSARDSGKIAMPHG